MDFINLKLFELNIYDQGNLCDLVADLTLISPPVYNPSAYNFDNRKFQSVSSVATFTVIDGRGCITASDYMGGYPSDGTDTTCYLFYAASLSFLISNNDLYDPETDTQNWIMLERRCNNYIIPAYSNPTLTIDMTSSDEF